MRELAQLLNINNKNFKFLEYTVGNILIVILKQIMRHIGIKILDLAYVEIGSSELKLNMHG